MLNFVGVICARKGSKRLPDKNLQKINGMTLVERAVKTLHEADIQPIIVASDFDLDFDPTQYHARHLYRAPNISDDKVPLQESVKWVYYSLDLKADYIIFLMPNCPMVTPKTVRDAVAMIQQSKFNVIRSYDPDGHENGLIVVRTKYLLDHFIDVYCGCVVCEGKEIHDKEDFDDVKKQMEGS